ncbi:hypothetical protein EMCRGX_G021545 [Ephydatia muelleri]
MLWVAGYIRRIVSGGEPSALLQSEVLSLSNEERKSLLKEAGISDEIKIGPAEVLAINVGLAIPWNKIRLLRRWLKASNVSLACEERMRHVSKRIVYITMDKSCYIMKPVNFKLCGSPILTQLSGSPILLP